MEIDPTDFNLTVMQTSATLMKKVSEQSLDLQ